MPPPDDYREPCRYRRQAACRNPSRATRPDPHAAGGGWSRAAPGGTNRACAMPGHFRPAGRGRRPEPRPCRARQYAPGFGQRAGPAELPRGRSR